MTKTKTPAKPQTVYRLYAQYVLIGAALGLYYGLTYKNPQREPDYVMPVVLSILAALLTTAVRSWKKGKTFTTILLDFIKVLAVFLIFMVSLELRQVIDMNWGRAGVIVFSIISGMLAGIVFAVRKKPAA